MTISVIIYDVKMTGVIYMRGIFTAFVDKLACMFNRNSREKDIEHLLPGLRHFRSYHQARISEESYFFERLSSIINGTIMDYRVSELLKKMEADTLARMPDPYIVKRDTYRELALKGDVFAQYALGLMHYDGMGIETDLREGTDWFEKASDQGHLRATCCLAEAYLRGRGRPRDYEKALVLYKQAADKGCGHAWKGLGYCHWQGLGVPKNMELSDSCYEKAVEIFIPEAEQGDPESQWELAECIMMGRGIKPNVPLAKHWLQKAAEQGHARAASEYVYIYTLGY